MPADLRGVLSARLGVLPDDVQGVLLAASCLRSPTTTMLERADGPVARSALQAAAVEGVVELEGARVRFTHPLLASAIYSGAPPDRRREAHRRLSGVVPNVEERARHLALSAEGPDEDAAAILSQAARAAAARGAPAAAAELAELAATLTPLDQAPARWRRRADAGDYLFRAGDTARARRYLEELAEEMPAGAARAEALLVLAEVLLYDAGDPVAVPVLEQALDEASADRLLQARIHISLARTCDLLYSARHADAALALAEQAGDPGLTGAAMVHKMYTDFMVGRGLNLELGDRAMDLEREGRPSRVEERAATWVGLCLVRADRFDEARRLLERMLQAAREEGDDSSLANLLAYMADLECWAGNWQRAERYAAECWEAGQQVEHRVWRVMTFFARALIDAQLGRLDAARAAAEEGLSVAAAGQDAWAVMLLNGVLGFAELSAGNLEAAEASLSSAADLADRISLAEPAAWRFHANQAEAVIGLGDLDRAEGLVERLEGWGHSHRTRMDAGHRGPLPGAAAGSPRRHRRRRPGAGGGPRPPPAPGDAVRAWPDPARHGAGAAQGQAQAGRQAAPATGPGDFRVPPGPPVGGTGPLGAFPHRAPPACPARADRHRGTRRRPGRIRPHQPAGRPGPVPQPPHGGGQPRPGLPQTGGVLAGRARRGDGPKRPRPAPA